MGLTGRLAAALVHRADASEHSAHAYTSTTTGRRGSSGGSSSGRGGGCRIGVHLTTLTRGARSQQGRKEGYD